MLPFKVKLYYGCSHQMMRSSGSYLLLFSPSLAEQAVAYGVNDSIQCYRIMKP